MNNGREQFISYMRISSTRTCRCKNMSGMFGLR